jgi:hypothetical protein
MWAALVVLGLSVASASAQHGIRGAGGIPCDHIGPGYEQSVALCYPRCRDGYSGNGPLCLTNCPSNYRDDGLYCFKPLELPRRRALLLQAGLKRARRRDVPLTRLGGIQCNLFLRAF